MKKRKERYIIILFFLIGLAIIFHDMATNSRYYVNVTIKGSPNLASTVFDIGSADSTSDYTISSGGNVIVYYNLKNKVGTNINTNKVNFYLKLLNEDEDEDEATDTNKIVISSVKIGSMPYTYVTGKGYGPINNLAYDGTEDTKAFEITLTCNENYDSESILAYKICILAENPEDTTKTTTKNADLNIEIEKEYTVTFNSNGGGAVSQQVIKKGGKITKPDNPIKDGYTFLGWYKESEFTNLWNFETDTVNSDKTLYAKWEKIGYTVTFNSNGGTAVESQFVEPGSTITKPTDPTKSGGYEFDGWYKESSLTNAWNFETDTITGDTIVYAKWEGPYIYFQLPPDWYTQENVYVYLVNNDESVINAAWRGARMTESDSTKKIFKYNLKNDNNIDKYTKCIFDYADRNGNTYRQTMDLEFSTANLGQIWVPKLYNVKDSIRIFGYNSNGLYLHYWNSTTKKGTTWPGEAMIRKSLSGGYGTIDTSKYDMFIFDLGDGELQTSDLNISSTLKSHQDLTLKFNSSGKLVISRFYYLGEWESYQNWISSGYNVWKSGDYVKFNAAQQEFGYSISY